MLAHVERAQVKPERLHRMPQPAQASARDARAAIAFQRFGQRDEVAHERLAVAISFALGGKLLVSAVSEPPRGHFEPGLDADQRPAIELIAAVLRAVG